jgi:hypothetical protein
MTSLTQVRWIPFPRPCFSHLLRCNQKFFHQQLHESSYRCTVRKNCQINWNCNSMIKTYSIPHLIYLFYDKIPTHVCKVYIFEKFLVVQHHDAGFGYFLIDVLYFYAGADSARLGTIYRCKRPPKAIRYICHL